MWVSWSRATKAIQYATGQWFLDTNYTNYTPCCSLFDLIFSQADHKVSKTLKQCAQSSKVEDDSLQIRLVCFFELFLFVNCSWWLISYQCLLFWLDYNSILFYNNNWEFYKKVGPVFHDKTMAWPIASQEREWVTMKEICQPLLWFQHLRIRRSKISIILICMEVGTVELYEKYTLFHSYALQASYITVSLCSRIFMFHMF